MQNTTSTSILCISMLILAAELAVIAASVYLIFTVPDKKIQYSSVSLFIMVAVGLRMVKPISLNKPFRYAMASVATMVYMLINQLLF